MVKRNRRNRKAPVSWADRDTHFFRCVCGKRGLRDRPAARRYARHLRQSSNVLAEQQGKRINVYSCYESGERLFHVGHLDPRRERPNLNAP